MIGLSCDTKDYLQEMRVEQESADENLMESLVHLGLPELALEILTEDYNVKISEYQGQVLIETDPSKYHFGRCVYIGFNELGFFMIRKDVRFLNETSSYQLRVNDFLILAEELVKEVE